MRKIAPLLLVIILLSACSQFRVIRVAQDPEWHIWGQGRVTEAGAVDNVSRKFEQIDLLALIEKFAPLEARTENEADSACAQLKDWKSYFTDTTEEACERERLYAAYKRFETTGSSSSRNAIQDEILRASEQRCRVYKVHLRRLQSGTNFILGSATTVLGGLGGIFTSASTARSLAASAGITSGVNAEFQESFFSTIIVPIIVDGIDVRRENVLSEIQENRRKSIADYTLQGALADATKYIATCSAAAGIAEVRKTVEISQFVQRNIGLKAMVNTLDTLRGITPTLNEGTVTPRRALASAKEEAQQLLAKFEKAVDANQNMADKEEVKNSAKAAFNRFHAAIQHLKACDPEDNLSNDILAQEDLVAATRDGARKREYVAELLKKRAQAEKLILIDVRNHVRTYRIGMEDARYIVAQGGEQEKDKALAILGGLFKDTKEIDASTPATCPRANNDAM